MIVNKGALNWFTLVTLYIKTLSPKKRIRRLHCQQRHGAYPQSNTHRLIQ